MAFYTIKPVFDTIEPVFDAVKPTFHTSHALIDAVEPNFDASNTLVDAVEPTALNGNLRLHMTHLGHDVAQSRFKPRDTGLEISDIGAHLLLSAPEDMEVLQNKISGFVGHGSQSSPVPSSNPRLSQRLSARDDLDELLGDDRLARAVVGKGLLADHLAGVAGGIVHRSHARPLLRRGVLQ